MTSNHTDNGREGAPQEAASREPEPNEQPALNDEARDEAAKEPSPETPRPEGEERGLLVVGIGASAGGLEAIGELLNHVTIDSMTFIVVQHLSPQHTSILAELLAKESKLHVVTATDGATLEANQVYVTPPNAQLAVSQGVLRVITMSSARGLRLPIDSLFRSLAEDIGERAIGVVLSGTGTDGTFGLKAIKAAGGLTFVQDPTTAKYDGMPRSALASGGADFCLAPTQIGEELARIAKTSRVRGVAPAPARPHEARIADAFEKLAVLIRSKFHFDLMEYKRPTLDRRIERRMMLREIEHLKDYVKFVESNQDELQAIYKDLLISVTSFFRDPAAFEALKTQAFPKLLEAKEPTAAMRVWVPACASGEEAYSIAICLLEYLEDNQLDTKVEIFATDIDEEAIQHARRGVYAANITQDVSPDRLARFFIQRDNEYVIARRVRDLVVFSIQNVLRDPPFSRIDLVSCRNLLIYLQPSAQQKLLRILHYALRPVGYLLLGASETTGDSNHFFSIVERQVKLYSKRYVLSEAPLDLALSASDKHEAPTPSATAPSPPPLNLQGLADRKVLELFGPPGVVINEELDILQFRGHTSAYLEPAPGAPNFNLLRFMRLDLHMQLKSAVRKALAEQRHVVSEATYTDGGKHNVLKLDVVPLQDPDTKARCLLVLFSSVPPPKEIRVVVAQGQEGEGEIRVQAERIQDLERELGLTKEYLQTISEEKDSTLEELKSANEELQSSNEELQSMNEELETSKEELQSTNEELSTVNDELKSRMAELSQTNDDLHNVLAGVDNAVVIVGLDLRIRRYTAAAEKLFNLVPGDIGRSISFLDGFLAIAPLEPKVAAVVQKLTPIEEEVVAGNNRWYAVKIIPYKTLDLAIRGALVTLVDIDVRKRAEAITHDVGAYAARFLAAIGHPLLIVNPKLRVVWCNDVFLSTFQLTREETVGSLLGNLGARELATPGLRSHLESVFASATAFREYELAVEIPERGRRTVNVGGSLIPVSLETPLALVSVEPLAR